MPLIRATSILCIGQDPQENLEKLKTAGFSDDMSFDMPPGSRQFSCTAQFVLIINS